MDMDAAAAARHLAASYRCCNAPSLRGIALGVPHPAESLQKCASACSEGSWCATVEWEPAEDTPCFLVASVGEGIEDIDSQVRSTFCVKLPEDPTARTPFDDAVHDHSVCNVPVPNAPPDGFVLSGVVGAGAKSVTEEPHCGEEQWICKDAVSELVVCAQADAASQLSVQGDWSCAPQLLPTSTSAPSSLRGTQTLVDAPGAQPMSLPHLVADLTSDNVAGILGFVMVLVLACLCGVCCWRYIFSPLDDLEHRKAAKGQKACKTAAARTAHCRSHSWSFKAHLQEEHWGGSSFWSEQRKQRKTVAEPLDASYMRSNSKTTPEPPVGTPPRFPTFCGVDENLRHAATAGIPSEDTPQQPEAGRPRSSTTTRRRRARTTFVEETFESTEVEFELPEQPPPKKSSASANSRSRSLPPGVAVGFAEISEEDPVSTLERTVDLILRQLKESTSPSSRHKVFLQQCRAWHPDKNAQDLRKATAAFQRLQASKSWFLRP
eukprot:TRINITY_DN64129_c0_g1_i1.p1 TRINITY_DN64129_c0_g1~~TRINITY_DN64129_c0_g1_i1.p1  ORF type:complete len:492 (-),score=114.70 TRINITY_DN64129_c0_g1_i1:125-1600(-)